jgi:alkanesulfonate monooxygenase SsuD/methylene tetrahydromethanopterin reductase-like flavin-dependent oxidoreductase (luciferase family)
VSWSGTTRPRLEDQRVWPPLGPGGLKAWIGVGGSPESVVRAVRHDMGMMLAIIGGDPVRFKPYVELYERACAQMGRTVRPLGVHSPGHVAETDAVAREELWPGYKALHDRIGRERGWPPTTRARFEEEADHGALHVGSPETVARKIAGTLGALGAARFDMKYSSGTLGHDKLMKSIELYGTRVIPMVRDLLA